MNNNNKLVILYKASKNRQCVENMHRHSEGASAIEESQLLSHNTTQNLQQAVILSKANPKNNRHSEGASATEESQLLLSHTKQLISEQSLDSSTISKVNNRIHKKTAFSLAEAMSGLSKYAKSCCARVVVKSSNCLKQLQNEIKPTRALNNPRPAFSLAEAMIAILLASIMLAAMAPLMTKHMKLTQTGFSSLAKPKTFKAVFDDSTKNGTPENIFKVPLGISNVFVTTIGGGGAGGNAIGGQVDWKTPGTYSWTVPDGVTEIEVTLVSGGAGGGAGGVKEEMIAIVTPGEPALTDTTIQRINLTSGTWTRPADWQPSYSVFLLGGGGGGGSNRVLENADLQGPGNGGKGGMCSSEMSLETAKFQVGGHGGAGHGVDYDCGMTSRLGGYGAGNGGWSLRCGIDAAGATSARGGYYNSGAYKGEDSSGQSMTETPSSLGTSKGGIGHFGGEPGAAGGSSSFLRGINMAGGGGGALRAAGGGGGGATEFGITSTNCQSAMAGGGGGGSGRMSMRGTHYVGGGAGGAGGGCNYAGGTGGNGKWNLTPYDGAQGSCANSTSVSTIPELAPLTGNGGGGDQPGKSGGILIKGKGPSNGGSGGGGGAIVPQQKIRVTPKEVLTIVVGKGNNGGTQDAPNPPATESSSLKRGAAFVLDTNWIIGIPPTGYTGAGGPGGGFSNGGCPYVSDEGEICGGAGGAQITVPGYSVVMAKGAGNNDNGVGCPFTSATPGGGDGSYTIIPNPPSGWCKVAKGGTVSSKDGQSATGFGGCAGGGGYSGGKGGNGAGGYARIKWGGFNAGGGSSGQVIERKPITNLKTNEQIPITVGKGGLSSTDKTLGKGGDSKFGSYTSALGGNRGEDSSISAHGKGGLSAGTGSLPGTNGLNGTGGIGGNAVFKTAATNEGVGGCGGNITTAICNGFTTDSPRGKAGSKPGAGGGGGTLKNDTAYEGGNGADGSVIVEWE